jgi:hypothetical protein
MNEQFVTFLGLKISTKIGVIFTYIIRPVPRTEYLTNSRKDTRYFFSSLNELHIILIDIFL